LPGHPPALQSDNLREYTRATETIADDRHQNTNCGRSLIKS